MKNLIKKSLLLGMGAISLTREKAENIVRELEEKGEVKSNEAKDFVNELVEKGEQERTLFKETVRKEMNSLNETMGLPTKKDLAALEERIKRLEDQVGISGGDGQQENQAAEFPSGE